MAPNPDREAGDRASLTATLASNPGAFVVAVALAGSRTVRQHRSLPGQTYGGFLPARPTRFSTRDDAVVALVLARAALTGPAVGRLRFTALGAAACFLGPVLGLRAHGTAVV